VSDELWLAIRWLHLIALAFFVGGQLVLAAVVVPVARGTPAMGAVARRFGAGTLFLVSLAIVWLGISLAHS
jgi:uncharacterized membrane protein